VGGDEQGVALRAGREHAVDAGGARNGVLEELGDGRRLEPSRPVGPLVDLELQRQTGPGEGPEMRGVGVVGRVAGLGEPGRDERPLDAAGVGREEVEIPVDAERVVRIARGELRSLRHEEGPVHCRSRTLQVDGGRQREGGAEALGLGELLGHLAAARPQPPGGERLEPVERQLRSRPGTLDEPVDAGEERRAGVVGKGWTVAGHGVDTLLGVL
jgi:hypothetical protein